MPWGRGPAGPPQRTRGTKCAAAVQAHRTSSRRRSREVWSSTGSLSRSATGQDMLLYEVEGRRIGRIGSPEGGQGGCQGQEPLLQQLQYAPFLRCVRQPTWRRYELES